jgi:peptidylprolyl isomerase
MLRTLRPARTSVVVAALLALAACRDVTIPLEDPATTTFAPSLRVDVREMQRTASGLYVQDLAQSTGAAADTGQVLSVRYAGWLANGRQFETNRDAVSPFTFTLGRGQVIRGWDEGLRGMRVGSRRRLVIPPALGYGSRTQGVIPAGSVLIFEIDLVGITAGS